MSQAENHRELLDIFADSGESRGGSGDDSDDFSPDPAPGYFAEIIRAKNPQDSTFNLRGLQLAIDHERQSGKLKGLKHSFTIDEVIRPQFVEKAAMELGLR